MTSDNESLPSALHEHIKCDVLSVDNENVKMWYKKPDYHSSAKTCSFVNESYYQGWW